MNIDGIMDQFFKLRNDIQENLRNAREYSSKAESNFIYVFSHVNKGEFSKAIDGNLEFKRTVRLMENAVSNLRAFNEKLVYLSEKVSEEMKDPRCAVCGKKESTGKDSEGFHVCEKAA